MDENEQLRSIVEEVVRQMGPMLRVESDAEYLTLREVARRTSFSYDFVYDAVQNQQLPAIQKGREWRVAVSDMRAWMDRDRAGAVRPTRPGLNEKVTRLMPGLKR